MEPPFHFGLSVPLNYEPFEEGRRRKRREALEGGGGVQIRRGTDHHCYVYNICRSQTSHLEIMLMEVRYRPTRNSTFLKMSDCNIIDYPSFSYSFRIMKLFLLLVQGARLSNHQPRPSPYGPGLTLLVLPQIRGMLYRASSSDRDPNRTRSTWL